MHRLNQNLKSTLIAVAVFVLSIAASIGLSMIIGALGAAFFACMAGFLVLEFGDYLANHKRAVVLVLVAVSAVIVQASFVSAFTP